MTAEIVERVRRSNRYRDVDPALVERLAAEELPRSRSAEDAVKRVKRRLHQAVGAFRASLPADGDPVAAMRGHASTRERLPSIESFYAGIWAITGPPRSIMDLGCGLNPLALRWMGLAPAVRYVAIDADERPLAIVRAHLAASGHQHDVRRGDLAREVPGDEVDVALLLKLVTTLDRQDPDAATRLLRGLRARHAVVSFTTRSLGGRDRGMERTNRERMDRLVTDAGRVSAVAEASVTGELVFVLTLDPLDG
ncbi:MAG: methyltransferase [Chloroflexi bacterium]|nr:methyltransferase [Chloroflexota bacterium]